MARIGLLSDSHGRAPTTRAAVGVLIDAGAEMLIHLGDVGNDLVLDALAGDVEAHVVFGNTDYDWQPLADYARQIGLIVDHPVGRLNIDGKILVFQHGDSRTAMTAALHEQATYLCHGHTHLQRDERVGMTRVINPGALQRASVYTVALLDTQADQVTFYPIGQG